MEYSTTFFRGTIVVSSIVISICLNAHSAAQNSAPSISPAVPSDIPGGAPNATIEQAATFAWQEFIALSWPAVTQTGGLNTRDTPDTSKHFGDPTSTTLVWETFRNKVEIYPGQNSNNSGGAVVAPNGYVNDKAQDYGYDATPRYVYDPKYVGTYPNVPLGEVKSADPTTGTSVPAWLNLDEDNEIDEAAMFAGASSNSVFPGQQFLYAAKANRAEYTYVAGNKWWWTKDQASPPFDKTIAYIDNRNGTTPPAGSKKYVSFPNGTIEVKTAWRRLTATELKSGRFHIQTVRYYVPQTANPGSPAWREETWGLCALHIIQKTPTAPHFIFATFGQADNILDVNGSPVEDEAGNVGQQYQSMSPMSPVIESVAATATSIQTLTAKGNSPNPGKRLYYENLPNPNISGHRVPQGMISVNRRMMPIPQEVIAINQAFQSAIKAYDVSNNINNSPWRYYKLVNVQWKPLDKPPGEPYTGPHPSSYYLSNIVVETDYNLQLFSGKLDAAADPDGLITDFTPSDRNKVKPPYKPITNVPYNGKFYNMGGCMGCHGNIAELGSDFSFILIKSSVKSPEFKLEFGKGN